MCRLFQKEKSVEEIIAANSSGMSDEQKAAYWYEICRTSFALLGKVDVPVLEIDTREWVRIAQERYPTLVDVKIADSVYFSTDFESLLRILKRDWSNLVPYVPEVGDCDKFATRLYSHLVDYYGLTGIVPVWGQTDRGSHGFNLAVIKSPQWQAWLIEPQTDAIFVDTGPMGVYTPRITAQELGIKRMVTIP